MIELKSLLKYKLFSSGNQEVGLGFVEEVLLMIIITYKRNWDASVILVYTEGEVRDD